MTLSKTEILNLMAWFSQPLFQAVETRENAYIFFAEFGYQIDDNTANAFILAMKPVLEAVRTLLNPQSPESDNKLELDQLMPFFTSLRTVADLNEVRTYFNTGFFNEVFDSLLLRFLSVRQPLVGACLYALGVLEIKTIAPGDVGGRQKEYSRIQFIWKRIADIISDSPKWAKEVYGWAGNPVNPNEKRLDYDRIAQATTLLMESTGLSVTQIKDFVHPELDLFLKNAGNESFFKVVLPFFNETLDHIDENSEPVFQNEAGVQVVPYGDLNQPQKLGFALAPYAKGNARGTWQLLENLTLSTSVDARATGGAFIAVTPDGIIPLTGGSVDAAFDFRFTYAKANKKIILLGSNDDNRLEVSALQIATEGNLKGEFSISGGVLGLKLVFDPKKDAFLKYFLSDALIIEAGKLLMGWRNNAGVYFEGGNSIEARIPLHLSLGPIHIFELGVALHLADKQEAVIDIGGNLDLGPLKASVQGFGLTTSIKASNQ